VSKALALTNCVVYTGERILRGHAVLAEDGKIAELPPEKNVPDGIETIDLAGRIAAPGFIDLQVNGGGGALFSSDPAPETLRTIAAAHERFGTLSWCPAVLSADMETTERCLAAVRAVMDTDIGVLGAHLEGPYLSAEKSGAHDKAFIRRAEDGEIFRLLETGKGIISLTTVAPESVGERHIQAFTGAGVRVFIGHTNAPCAAAEAAFAAGVTGVTHLYNAMSQLSGREPGVVGAAFAASGARAGIIADGIHADWLSIRIAKDIMKKRLFLVTDAMAPAGAPDAEFTIGGETVTCRDGRCAMADGTLAGSALDMASAVRNCVKHCAVALDEALRMATVYPAEALEIADRLGYIKPGYRADLVFLNGDLTVNGIMRGGKVKRFG
jgi:N-acetylglucosamine-6-phosphate deacetylase